MEVDDQQDDDISLCNMSDSNLNQDDLTDPDMPDLVSDGSDFEDVYFEKENYEYNNESFSSQNVNENIEFVLNNNNIKFCNSNEFKFEAKYLNEKPQNLDYSKSIGAVNINNNQYTNVECSNGQLCNNLFKPTTEIIIITGNDNPHVPCILFSNAIYSVENNECILYGQLENYQQDDLEDVYYGNAKIIRSRNSQWYIHCPIRYENGEIIKTWIFADSGANTPCVNTKWALETFPNMIARNKIAKMMLTPGGPIKPEYSLWMTFPAKKNTVLKVKMNLVNDLPVDILADINMLEAFGYAFRDETPPIFQHDEKQEIELDLKEDDEFISNRIEANWFDYVTQLKLKQINSGILQGDDSDKICLVDKIFNNGKIIFDSNNKSKSKEIVEQKQFDDNKYNNENNETIIEVEPKNQSKRFEIDCKTYNIHGIIDNINENTDTAKVWKKCLFLTSRESYLAKQDEIDRAQKQFENKRLNFPDYSYLKEYPRKYGKQFEGLYEAVMDWKNRYSRIFATHTFSRKTMYTKPARLGIKPEHRDKVMFCPQYPISAEKRIHMINYTLINEKNGFWYKIPRSKHGIPYLMVPKKDAKGAVARYRPAFDARVVNQYCELMQCVMPTFTDFRNLHQRGGLTTLADIKNFFDCIPLHWEDRKYAVCFTPIGIYCMLCMTYGFMNAAPEAQARTNDLVYNVMDSLAYIDDITIKHSLKDGTKGVIESLERLGKYCIEKNIQLNPKKFFPATDESESFGFKNTMIGEMVSDTYKRKILAVAKPMTKADMRSFDGLCNYVNNHIYHNKRIFYWLNRLVEETDPHTKGGRLKWNKEANLAWEQLQYLLNHLPILHYPNREGMFCLIVDACNYGVGASLYQDHSGEGQPADWKLVDLWSKVMPTQLRHCHSMIHEAYGVVSACEHWQFYLIRARFILSTDNMAVARIFGQSWKKLSPITQKQLIRLRSKLGSFNFVSFHVPGIKNDLADGLSRFTVELLKKHRGKDDNPYPLELRAIESTDTMTPLLTGKEKEEFDLIKQECEMLTEKYGNLKNQKIKPMANMICLINDNFNGDLDIKCIETKKGYNYKREYEKFVYLVDEIDKDFQGTMHEYISNSDYLYRKELKDYIDFEMLNCYRKGDDEMTGNETNSFRNCICSIANCLNEMMDETCIELQDQLDQEYWQHLIDMKLINEVLDDQYVNAIDEPYDPYREREFGKEKRDLVKSTIITRSKAKRIREKEKSNLEDDDSIEQERKFSRINVRFDNIRDEMETHEDLMIKLFGKRNRLDILDFEKYREYQESDNILAIVIRLFKQPNKKKWDDDDLDTLYEQDNYLYQKLMHGGILIEDNLLKCYDFHPVTQARIKKIIVPFFLRGKLMEYAHHNLYHHHLSEKYTFSKLARKFWWSTIATDVRSFCNRCISCQFVKGGPRKRAPLMERYRPLPRQHVFADILGPVYSRYYILVLVDYATGYSMLIAMEGCDALSIAHAIINHWIRIFGCFQFLETDWGSGFTSTLFKYLSQLLNYEHEIAEPRNHRSIGKVERVIGFLQAVINHFNLLLGNELTDFDDADAAWTRIKVLLPFIQFGFNQRKMRITGISPNEAIFGMNMNEISDIGRMNAKIEEFADNRNLDREDYILLRNIRDNIVEMNKIADSNWKEVTKLSVKSYNNKYNITKESVIRNRERFKEGDQVLYFIGDKQVARYKWREKWSGPWTLESKINDATVIITDPRNGNQKRVSIDRIKKFIPTDYIDYKAQYELSEEYIKFQEEILKMMSNYSVRVADNEWNLDYSRFDTSKISIDVDKKEEENENNNNNYNNG